MKPTPWKKRKLGRLALRIARDSAMSIIRNSSVPDEDSGEWRVLEESDVASLADELEFLDLLGLLVYHPTEPCFFRIKEVE